MKEIQSKRRKRLLALAAIAVLAFDLFLLTGCKSFNATAYNTERLAVDTAITATHTFNLYYASATNSLSPESLARLNKNREQVYDADRKLAAAAATLDQLRLAYVSNASDTNRTAMQIALETVTSQSANIVSLVKMLMQTPQ